jgi:predicted aspartyl protease
LNGVTTFGVGGIDEADKVTVMDLSIGPLHERNVDLMVTGRGRLSHTLDGLLGESVLAQGDLEIDFAHKALRQFKPSGCQGDEVVYWGGAYSVAELAQSNDETELGVYVVLNGKRVLALLDTGASTSVVTPSVAKAAGVANSAAAGRTVGLGGRPVDVAVATFPTVSIGEETVRNAQLHVADLYDADRVVPINSHVAQQIDGLPEMLLGADFIKAHRIYVARSQRKLYVSYLGGPIFQLPSGSTARTQNPAPAAAPSAP